MPLTILPVVARITSRTPEGGHGRLGLRPRNRTAIGHSTTNIAGLFGLGLLLGVAGCASIGPGTVPRDRVDYITAVAEVMERADAPERCSDALWRRAELC